MYYLIEGDEFVFVTSSLIGYWYHLVNFNVLSDRIQCHNSQ